MLENLDYFTEEDDYDSDRDSIGAFEKEDVEFECATSSSAGSYSQASYFFLNIK